MKSYDKDFIRQLHKGNSKAQKQLFEQLYASMFRVCQRYIARQDEAEDCMMKAFLKVFQQVSNFEHAGDHSLYFWVRKIMVNECLMSLRRHNSFYMMPEEHLPETAAEAEVWETLEAEDLNNLVLRLPVGYRTVFNLFVVEGYGHKEIAGMLGITESTSKSQLVKARGKLKQLLDQMNFGYGKISR